MKGWDSVRIRLAVPDVAGLALDRYSQTITRFMWVFFNGEYRFTSYMGDEIAHDHIDADLSLGMIAHMEGILVDAVREALNDPANYDKAEDE